MGCLAATEADTASSAELLNRPLDTAAFLARAYGHMPEVRAVEHLLLQRADQRGAGVTIGLIEAALDVTVDDLIGAEWACASFAEAPTTVAALYEHGTHSATLLVGQGHSAILGLVPRARFRVATVVGSSGQANPDRVAAAIDWLVAEGSELVAIPFGDSVDHDVLVSAIEHAYVHGVRFFAAAGNLHPQMVLFPARHLMVCAVGASDQWGQLRPECCRSPKPDQIAPGTDIPALVATGRVSMRSGSSVACVIAMGLAALQCVATQPGASALS